MYHVITPEQGYLAGEGADPDAMLRDLGEEQLQARVVGQLIRSRAHQHIDGPLRGMRSHFALPPTRVSYQAMKALPEAFDLAITY